MRLSGFIATLLSASLVSVPYYLLHSSRSFSGGQQGLDDNRQEDDYPPLHTVEMRVYTPRQAPGTIGTIDSHKYLVKFLGGRGVEIVTGKRLGRQWNATSTAHRNQIDLRSQINSTSTLKQELQVLSEALANQKRGTKTLPPLESRIDRVCRDYLQPSLQQQKATQRNTAGLTVLISTFSRFEYLEEQIMYYAQSPIVLCIVVVWQNIHLPLPKSLKVGVRGIEVIFVAVEFDTLNTRFHPLRLISTDAVFIIDDDMKVHLQDLDILWQAWRHNREKLVGFFPRWIETGANGELKYLFQSEDPPEPVSMKKFKPGYSLMLTKAMIIHKNFLFSYTCGDTPLHRVVHAMVDKAFNCEDIGMSLIATLLQNDNLRSEAPVLYVQPRFLIGDFGKQGGSGLHLRQDHNNVRTQCLTVFADALGNLTKTRELPLQKTVVKTWGISASHTKLALVPIHGKRRRVHVDCTTKGTSSNHRDSCSWVLPKVTDYVSHWASSYSPKKSTSPLRS